MKLKQLIIYLFFIFILIVKTYYIVNFFKITNLSEKSIYHNPDADHYCQIAKNISQYQTYSDNNSAIATQFATWRPPFWPLVLSSFFYISENPIYVLIIKIIFEFTLLLIIILHLKRKYKNEYWYLLFLLLIEPQYLKYSLTYLSESLTAILILILTVLFLGLKKTKKTNILIPIIAGLTILTHPVSAFFIFTFLFIYMLKGLKTNFKTVVFHGLLFVSIVSSWPIRNHLTFNKGLYLTVSQGVTFSKGWNEKVITEFTNVEGDLANENLNLKYLKNLPDNIYTDDYIDNSKRYEDATNFYISTLTLNQKMAIAFKKIKSNFNPFPEKPKAGFFENLSILFRFLYLFLFLQLLIRIFQFKKFNFESNEDKAFLVILYVLIGQVVMSTYIYTGFRFNAIYSLCLLLCFLIVNKKNIQRIFNLKQNKFEF